VTTKQPARLLAVIAGSGLGRVADRMTARRSVGFADIPGVGACTVAGHAGEVREGTIGGRECRLVLGRRHGYEGEATAVRHLVTWLAGQGVTDLLVTSAAGALRRSLDPGDIVVVHDILDRQNLRGVRADASGAARRPDPRHTRRLGVDASLTAAVERAALRARVGVQRGSVVCGIGPAYETSAEVGALQMADGDAATMSAAPEIAAAAAAGLRVAAIALITNPCTGIASAAPNHDEVLRTGERASGKLAEIIGQLVMEM
jgi:purine-nucleoside phosphorylase